MVAGLDSRCAIVAGWHPLNSTVGRKRMDAESQADVRGQRAYHGFWPKIDMCGPLPTIARSKRGSGRAAHVEFAGGPFSHF